MGMYSFSIFLYAIKLHFFCKHVFTGYFATVTLLVINLAPCHAKQAIQQPVIRFAVKIKY